MLGQAFFRGGGVMLLWHPRTRLQRTSRSLSAYVTVIRSPSGEVAPGATIHWASGH